MVKGGKDAFEGTHAFGKGAASPAQGPVDKTAARLSQETEEPPKKGAQPSEVQAPGGLPAPLP